MSEQSMGTATLSTPPVKTAWDYAVVTMHCRNTEILEQALKERGSQGWELIDIQETTPNDYRCVFRRPLW